MSHRHSQGIVLADELDSYCYLNRNLIASGVTETSPLASPSKGIKSFASSSNRYRNRAEDGGCLISMADLKNGSVRIGSTASKSRVMSPR
jgi:hypothetical protein